MELPKEIREQIYSLVVFSEATPDGPNAILSHNDGVNHYCIARRRTSPKYSVRLPGTGLDLLDYLQHRSITGLFGAVLRFEGRRVTATIGDLSKIPERRLGFLAVLVDWFFKSIVLHVHFDRALFTKLPYVSLLVWLSNFLSPVI